MRRFWLVRLRPCVTSWKCLTRGSFARSSYPNAWFTALCCALWLPQWFPDSMLALVISSANSRTVQTRLFSEYDPGATRYHVKISNTVDPLCESSFLYLGFPSLWRKDNDNADPRGVSRGPWETRASGMWLAWCMCWYYYREAKKGWPARIVIGLCLRYFLL